jgi:hypothetical protein
MSLELQRQYENINIHTIILHLKKMFDATSRSEIYEIFKELYHYKMTEVFLVNTHVLIMISYFEKLGQLGFFMNRGLSVHLVSQSLY